MVDHPDAEEQLDLTTFDSMKMDSMKWKPDDSAL